MKSIIAVILTFSLAVVYGKIYTLFLSKIKKTF